MRKLSGSHMDVLRNWGFKVFFFKVCCLLGVENSSNPDYEINKRFLPLPRIPSCITDYVIIIVAYR